MNKELKWKPPRWYQWTVIIIAIITIIVIFGFEWHEDCLKWADPSVDLYTNIPVSALEYACDGEWNLGERCIVGNMTEVGYFNESYHKSISFEFNSTTRDIVTFDMHIKKVEPFCENVDKYSTLYGKRLSK